MIAFFASPLVLEILSTALFVTAECLALLSAAYLVQDFLIERERSRA